MNLVKTSLKYSQVTLTILSIVFIAGIYLLFTMPRREDAKISIRQGMIYAFYPGGTASQVEQRVTKKIEDYLFRFDEVNKSTTYSTSKDGISIINVDLMENVEHEDIFWNKIRHELMIAKSLDLPSEVIGPVVNANFGDVESLLISIGSNQADDAQLLEYSKLIEADLRTIPATSKIKRIGEQNEQITITTRNNKLAQYGLDITQIIKILQSQNKQISAGNLEDGNKKIAFHTSGNYSSQEELAQQIVGTSQQGAVIRLKDVANIQREDRKPSSSVAVNSEPAIILAVETLDGNNIVNFGKEVEQHLNTLKQQIPTSINITTIVNQPQVVKENVNHFLFEFFGALVAVVLVVMLLLPFRIALVSSMAIPMTVAFTIVLMKACGIQLQQVSLASLIVVLGMIVDDAIVIADNYVELLDKGVTREEAAWRSATELVIPILTATATIIAAFLPMVVISGRVGEFIYALPITVSIALTASFIVAMFLTPILCYLFIKKGLHDHTSKEEPKKKRFSVLDSMQRYHTRILIWCTIHKKITIFIGIFSIILCFGLIKLIPQKFFPAAERNQFVIDLWMPTGTQYSKTDSATKRIEKILKEDPRIVSYASFVGMSAPRFYYNFSPEFPSPDFAQILINTTTEKTTETLIADLEEKVNALIPEGIPFVRQMQQGPSVKAPVEVRIYGDDISRLQKIKIQIDSILRSIPGHGLLRSSFGEDFYALEIKLKEEASKLGFTNEAISQTIYAGFTGATITTLYENDNEIDVVFRLNSQDRNNIEQLKNIYLTSPATGKKIPLRQIADIVPSWHTGKIMHRNGVRVLTVECDPDRGVFASQILEKIQPQIAQLDLPIGYRIEYGGELESKQYSSTQLFTALLIGMLLIFIILLVEFHTLKKVFIVMCSIPLSMFGALLGLWITKSNMGFTAFISLISLSGIVVRNAIILVDYADELMVKKGAKVERAAIEAAQRRLRPIFLTSSAAAIGVIPMLLSGSQLWEPMAACLSFGILWSMVMALLVLPVVYIVIMKKKNIVHKKHLSKTLIALIFFNVFLSPISAQDKPILSLNKAIEATMNNNRLIKIKSYQTQEKQAKWGQDKVKRYPMVNVNAGYMYNANLATLNIAPGSFGSLPVGSLNIPLPINELNMNLTEHNMYAAGVSLYQPLTQQGKINAAVGVSHTENDMAKIEQQKTTAQILQTVEKLYYALLLAEATQQEKWFYFKTAESKLKDAQNILDAGKTINVNVLGLQAQEASNEQEYLKACIEVENYTNDLSSLTGLSIQNFQLDTSIFKEEITIPDSTNITQNYDLRLASLSLQKTNHALAASKWNNVPDVGVFAGYTYLGGSPLFPKNNPIAGVALKWNLQDLFSNHKITIQRKLQQQQADENRQQIEEDTRYNIQKAYRKIKQYAQLKQVAQKSLEYNKQLFQLEQNSSIAGYQTSTQQLENEAKLKKAQNEWLAACIGYRMAVNELKLLLGK